MSVTKLPVLSFWQAASHGGPFSPKQEGGGIHFSPTLSPTAPVSERP